MDAGAGGNILPLRTYKQMFDSRPTHCVLKPEPITRLKSYSGHQIRCLGSISFDTCRINQKTYTKHKFYVINVQGPAVVGLATCDKLLGLVKLNIDAVKHSVSPASDQSKFTKEIPVQGEIHPLPPTKTKIKSMEELKKWFPDCFDGMGCFKGNEQLHLKSDATPFIDQPCRCPIHLHDKIKAKLQNMIEKGIIRPVTNHTDWCSSLTYAIKKDGSLCVCLEPQKLNQAFKRCPYKIPT